MRAITITQPFAQLIVLGEKRIETRGPRFPQPERREQLAIHAAKGLTGLREFIRGHGDAQALRTLCGRDPFAAALKPVAARHATAQASLIANIDIPWEDVLPRGAVVAVAHVQGVEPTGQVRGDVGKGHVPGYGTVGRHELAFGDYRPGSRLAIFLHHVTPLLKPVTCPGALGLWDLPAHIERQVRRELHLAFEHAAAPLGDFDEPAHTHTPPPAAVAGGERDRTHASGGAA